MLRFREQTTETAGFYNTVGFNDDTRAFLSIPARHDVARRVDCAFLARLVAEHRLDEESRRLAVARGLAYRLPKAGLPALGWAQEESMRVKVLQATHPDMIVGLDTPQKLRGHYLLTELFVAR